MENLVNHDRYIFPCNRWLSKKEEDKQIVRELPAQGPGIKQPLRVMKYMVDVYTGKQMSAGTDANVFINIFGEVGDTGGSKRRIMPWSLEMLASFLDRPLEYSSKNTNKFEKGQVRSDQKSPVRVTAWISLGG